MVMRLGVVTLCSGYDSQCLALERLKSRFADVFDYELLAWAEIDRYAIEAHDVLFPEYGGGNMGDITTCDWSALNVDHVDLLTYSTPCQSISVAGRQEGLKKGSGTASSVIWSVLRAIDVLRPKYLLMENVKALISNKFIGDFREWQNELSRRGYTNFVKVLDAQDYGVPQHRERVFMVSILGDDISFHFPEPFTLERKLKDLLEEDVDEKYFLTESTVRFFLKNSEDMEKRDIGFRFEPTDGEGVAKTITTKPDTRMEANYVKIRPVGNSGYRIRKLTPREVFRLMDVDDEYIDKLLDSGISNNQLYKMAGNSIVVNVLFHIFRKMFVETANESSQLELF